jgi:hypothetical protein
MTPSGIEIKKQIHLKKKVKNLHIHKCKLGARDGEVG